MSHNILVQNAVFAKHIDTLNRSAKATIDLDNGNVIMLNTGISSVSGEREVFLASTPTDSSPTDIWMVAEPEVVMTNNQYKGLDPDIRNFYNVAGTPFTAFKPKKYDIITVTADDFTGARTSETYCNITAGSVKLAWASTNTSATMFELLETTFIALPSGTLGSNRVTSYRLECIAE